MNDPFDTVRTQCHSQRAALILVPNHGFGADVDLLGDLDPHVKPSRSGRSCGARFPGL